MQPKKARRRKIPRVSTIESKAGLNGNWKTSHMLAMFLDLTCTMTFSSEEKRRINQRSNRSTWTNVLRLVRSFSLWSSERNQRFWHHPLFISSNTSDVGSLCHSTQTHEQDEKKIEKCTSKKKKKGIASGVCQERTFDANLRQRAMRLLVSW